MDFVIEGSFGIIFDENCWVIFVSFYLIVFLYDMVWVIIIKFNYCGIFLCYIIWWINEGFNWNKERF